MLEARRDAGFRALASFPDPEFRYLSPDLFPVFSNRLPSPSRPEYAEFVQWLSAPETPHDPIAMLGLTGGQRITDSFEVFPTPDRDENGLFHIRFFLHGLSHFPPAAQARADKLKPGEPLLLQHDFQNRFDRRALMLRTSEQTVGDIYSLGFCPRFLLHDLETVIASGDGAADVRVVKVNPFPAPSSFRVMCSLSASWPPGYEPFSSDEYQPFKALLPPRFVSPGIGTYSANP